MMEFGKWLIVIAGCIGGLSACFACIWFGVWLWKEDEKIAASLAFVVGILFVMAIAGLLLIGLEKGI